MRLPSCSSCTASLAVLATIALPCVSSRLVSLSKRDAYTTFTSGEANNEGEAHGPIQAPSGSVFTSLPVGNGGEEIAAYWTAGAKNTSATQAFIMIHGKLRDGDDYWTTMDSVLNSAIQDNTPGVDKNAIVIAPQFFSADLNSGQYTSNQLAWGDINTWQAGDVAIHPQGTTLNSFDALNALVASLADKSTYPSLTNITVVGHGGGGQLIQRYSMTAENSPAGVHIRYIHGDPSSCAYFTTDRPSSMNSGESLPATSSCGLFNTWRYGFTNFSGTASGLLTPKQYFQQYITRDIISIVGYQDVDTNGDTTCMGQIQGGTKRRDRNLSWWQYVNTLARTNEDLNGFPATYNNIPDWSDVSKNAIQLQLIVVENADHDAGLVFSSDEGRAALFSTGKMPTGWRPSGWTAATPVAASNNSPSSSSSSSTRSSHTPTTSVSSEADDKGSSGVASLASSFSCFSLLLFAASASLLLLS